MEFFKNWFGYPKGREQKKPQSGLTGAHLFGGFIKATLVKILI
jgi:hypothetical protein